MHTLIPTQQVLLIENDLAVIDLVLAAPAERDCHVREQWHSARTG